MPESSEPGKIDALATAVQHHQAGRLELAEQIYRQILQANPADANVIHLLGIIASQAGRFDEAIADYRRALELVPDFAEAIYNLGTALQSQGKLDEAGNCFRRAIGLRADFVEAYNNLGNVLQAQGNQPEAVACLQRAVALRPEFAEAHSNLGIALEAAGKLEAAVAAYRRALELTPSLPEAHYNLGNAYRHQGALAEAAASYERALALEPDFAEAHNHLGHVFRGQGRLREASESYRRALELKPDFDEAYNNLGAVLSEQGNVDEAIACYRRALALRPDSARFHYNLGIAWQMLGKLDEAVGSYQRALALNAEFAEAHGNLGSAWHAQGRLEEAAAAHRRALALKPGYAEAHCNLGIILRAQGKLEEAILASQRALALKPDFAAAHNNLGVAFNEQGKVGEAIACFQRALELKPDFDEALNNLGVAWHAQGNLDEAVASLRCALELKPDYAEAQSNLGTAYKDQGKLREAIACHRRALELKPESWAIHGSLLYTLWFCPDLDSRAIYEEHCQWTRLRGLLVAEEPARHFNDADPECRLRIGYISPDFRTHCQALFTAPLFSAHDQQQFEMVCYSDVACPDLVTERLRSSASQWREIHGLADEKVARLVQQDQIDILVDLTMHMAKGRPLVFARRPAPVQVCWLAYPGTTGNPAIAYRLTDPFLDPPGQSDSYYSEESVRLADTFWCYDPLAAGPPVNSLPALTKGQITFGCLNNFCKVNAGVLRLWARTLRAVEGSRLLLLAPTGSSRAWVVEVFEQEGVARERITFVNRRPRDQYLAVYHHIDIGLDTLPYNGHTTSLDALWMGVPVVTIVGQTVVGRAGLSQLNNLGLPEFIAHSPDEFVQIAAATASDLNRLNHLRGALRARMESSPLMDAPRFARSIEAAYRTLWQRWCAAQASESSSDRPSSHPAA